MPELDIVRAVRDGPAAYQDSMWNRRFRNLFRNAREHFEAVPLGQAEVVCYPHDEYTLRPDTLRAARDAAERGLRCIFFRTSDAPTPVEVPPGGILYRHSIFRSEQVAGELAKPAFAEDFLDEHGGQVLVRPKRDVPSVGFCGFVSNPLMRAVYRAAGRKQKAEGLALRARLLSALERVPGLQCNFVRNNQFMMGKHGLGNADRTRAARVREQFVRSIFDSDYTLCVRGAGNFSYRFYEVLSAGRIPVFVDTDCVMPFEDQVEWRDHCVWVGHDEIAQMGEKLLAFHASISDTQIRQLQLMNRDLWDRHLEPLAFYRHALGAAARRGKPSDTAAY